MNLKSIIRLKRERIKIIFGILLTYIILRDIYVFIKINKTLTDVLA